MLTKLIPWNHWSGQQDSNLRPAAPKAGAPPDLGLGGERLLREFCGDWSCAVVHG